MAREGAVKCYCKIYSGKNKREMETEEGWVEAEINCRR